MKIAIISDSHDNVPNLKTALDYINKEKISVLIHCGDLAAPSMLKEVIAPNFAGEIHMVFGNVGDPDLLVEIIKNLSANINSSHETLRPYGLIKVHGQRGEFSIDSKKIAFCHFPEDAKELAQTREYDIVFYGHTHKPWMEKFKIKNLKLKIVQLVNPGTLAGLFNKATFAIYDTLTDKLELKILDQIR